MKKITALLLSLSFLLSFMAVVSAARCLSALRSSELPHRNWQTLRSERVLMSDGTLSRKKRKKQSQTGIPTPGKYDISDKMLPIETASKDI